MQYKLEDLGVAAHGDLWFNWQLARDPRNPGDGVELALGSLARGGFILIDPKKREAIQIKSERPVPGGEGVTQAPNGDIYQCDYGPPSPTPLLVRWDWTGRVARVAAEVSVESIMSIDAGADGCIYLPDYSPNVMYRFNPDTGTVENLGDFHAFGQFIRNVFGAPDGLMYVTSNRYGDTGIATRVVGFNPRTREKFLVEAGGVDGASVRWGGLVKDGNGRVLVPSSHWGRSLWHELVDGKLRDIDQKQVRLTPADSPLAFADGSYIKSVVEKEVTLVEPDGKESKFTIAREDEPLRLFSIESGGGKIWNGTFMPLQLSSYDLASGKITDYGNPTRTQGEPYNMVFTQGKLYLACYCEAHVARYDPSKPWRKDNSIHANPAQLGQMKETGLPLQRPVGKAVDAKGRIFFAAMGGYGCLDSGIARIDPRNEEMVRWLYPNTTVGAIAFHKASGQLLVTERREGEKGVRFTFVSPEDGSIAWSEEVVIDDGSIPSLLDSGREVVFGLHAHRATLFAFDMRTRKIVASLPEMGVGHHCCNALIDGPDGRIWGLTTDCVYAVGRDLKSVEVIAKYAQGSGPDSNRFGICWGEDGHLYFPNGTNLMRVRVTR